MIKNTTGGYISIKGINTPLLLEEFKGETFDKESIFPKGLGAEHPFDFESIEKLLKKCGLVDATLNKLTDNIMSDFEIKLKNPNSQALVDSFVKNSNLQLNLRTWIKEGLGKGNGFIEIDLKNQKVRVMNANYMYVKRDKKGKVLKYNQWTKPFKFYSRDSKDIVPFEAYEIAHLPINKIPNDPYGIGIIWSSERIIENLILNEQDLQKLVSRKAGAPYHFKVGEPGANTPTSVIDDINSKLQYLTNRTEWVTDGDIDIKSISFSDLGKNLTEAQLYWFKQFLAGVEVPEVLFGSGQLNEGIAKVQLEAYKRKIQSYQTLIASIIEEKIIRPLLRANSPELDEAPEFIWELPTEEDINLRLQLIQNSLSSILTSPMMRAQLEIEQAKLLGFEELAGQLPSPEEAQKIADEKEQMQNELDNKEREEEEKIPQPEVPGAKKRAKELREKYLVEFIKKVGNKFCVFSHQTGKNFGCYTTREEAEKRLAQIKRFKDSNEIEIKEEQIENKEINIQESEEMTIKDWVNLKEIQGFNYTDYLIKILDVIKKDKFADLSAITEKDIENGLLSERDVKKLREILKTGFKDNQTIKQIEDNINKHIELKDRITDTSTLNANNRANIIARTETVRLANEGLKDLYLENNITKVRWLAAISNRTCEFCEALNGRVFDITEISVGNGQPPLHPACRCSLISIIE